MADIKKPNLMILAVLADRKPVDLHIFRNYQSAQEILNEYNGTTSKCHIYTIINLLIITVFTYLSCRFQVLMRKLETNLLWCLSRRHRLLRNSWYGRRLEPPALHLPTLGLRAG